MQRVRKRKYCELSDVEWLVHVLSASTRRHANSELGTPLTAGSDKNTQRNATGIQTRVCMCSGAPTHNPASCQFFLFFGENRDYLVRNDPEKPGRAF